MIITEFKTLEKTAGSSAHIRRVLYAALDTAVYTDADLDVVTAACLLHEYKEPLKALLNLGWSEDKIMKVQNCIDALNGEGLTDTAEARVLSDAHNYDDCGVIGEVKKLLDKKSAEEYLSEPFDAAVYTRFFVKRCETSAKDRRRGGENFYNALKNEIGEITRKGEAMLKETLEAIPIYNKLLLVPVDSGLAADGYFLWSGSVIYAAGEYHMFAPRWHEHLKFPDGCMVGSEIAHAVSASPEGPFALKNVVIGARHRGWWDSQSARDPQIVRIGGTYLLYYTGAGIADGKTKRIGCAAAHNINGKWDRPNKFIELGHEPCGGPSVCETRGGGILLAFVWGDRRVGIAKARGYDGEYKVLNEDIMPGIAAEAPFLYKNGEHYEMIVEDVNGAFTGHGGCGAVLESSDGTEWKVKKHCLAYDHTLIYSDLSIIKAERRGSPKLLFNKDGRPTHLYTGVLYKGKARTVCQPVDPAPD